MHLGNNPVLCKSGTDWPITNRTFSANSQQFIFSTIYQTIALKNALLKKVILPNTKTKSNRNKVAT